MQLPMCPTQPAKRDRTPILLDDVPATLLIPLCARAAETERTDPIVRDPKAIEILESLDYDFSHLRRLWMTQVDIAVRTEIFDEATSRFLAEHPRATVVNLGAGLDGRFWRLDNGQVTWLDLDLPEVVQLRRKFYAESDRNRFIARSILDFTWIDEVELRAGQPLLIIVEGVLHYFEEAQVRQLFRRDRRPIAGGRIAVPFHVAAVRPPAAPFPSVPRVSRPASGGASGADEKSRAGIRGTSSSRSGRWSTGILPAGAGCAGPACCPGCGVTFGQR